MKTYLSILASFALVLTACTSPQGAASSAKYSDDVYYSSADAAADRAQLAKEEQARKEKAKREAEEAALAESKRSDGNSEDYYSSPEKRNSNSDNYSNNTYADEPFDYDDYYDYEYSTRLRRFHSNIGSYGYYDNYYTNSYWYTGNPYNYGVSVYMGYNFWGPSYYTYTYNPSYYWYSNVGWSGYYGYGDPYGYGGYGYPGYGYGYGYGSPYMYGYNNGYWNGYNDGYYSNNYFNSYDNNSYYYGPRGSQTANSTVSTRPTMAHRYMNVVEAETKKPFEETLGRANNPNLRPTTVNDYLSKPVYLDSDNGRNPSTGTTTRPANANNPDNRKPVYTDKPVNNGDLNNTREPVRQPESDYYERPTRSPVTDKPATQQQPATERPSRDNNRQPVQKPVYEQPKPTYERPREQARPAPAPRENSTINRGGSSTPSAPAPAPRRR